jgi:hypothetical protein
VINKKPIAFTGDSKVANALNELSKAALADMVIDLLRKDAGDIDGDLDGPQLLAVIRKTATPVLCVRGDHIPKSLRQP